MATVRTVATVDIRINNNVTWADVFQFGCVAVNDECCASDVDTSWDFNSKTFLLDVKVTPTATTPQMALSSANGKIVVIDAASRILAVYVLDTEIRTELPVGSYVYDLVMVDSISGARTLLMKGSLVVDQGVTIED